MLQRALTFIFFLLILSIVDTAYAVAPGLYMGLAAGPSSNSGSETNVVGSDGSLVTATPRSSQFGFRADLGYKFIQYFAIESGFSVFSLTNFDTKGVPTVNSPQAGVGAIDFSGIASFAFYGIEIFGKAGLSLNQVIKSAAFDIEAAGSKRSTEWTFGPLFGLGISYELNQNWVADLAYTRLRVNGSLGNIQFVTLGISYHFVDTYCGQFLC